MKHEEGGYTTDEGRVASAKIGSHGGSGNFESPGGKSEAVEHDGLILAVQSPVQFEGKQVLRVRADLLHVAMLVLDPGLVGVRHCGRI